jgi:Tol biopolymer transport system component
VRRVLQGMAWIALLAGVVLGCHETTAPKAPRYDLTFDDGWAIYETPIDSPHVRLIMKDTLPTYDISWSPDGRNVAFTRQYWNGPAYYRVVTCNTVDGTQHELTHGPDDSFQPAWSPDGTRIAYLSRPSGGGDATLRAVRPDGADDHQLGTARYYVRPPEWSPDGRQLAATRNDMMIVVVDAASGAVVREIAPGMSPTWSPDGRLLAFVSGGITLEDADGANYRIVQFFAYEPAWSPDGNWIAVQTGLLGIYLISADSPNGTAPRLIASGYRPAWRLRQP